MAHPDLDALLSAALPFARQMLAKHGEFYPYGVSMKEDGEISMDAAHAGSEHPPSAELIAMLQGAYRERRDRLRACAIVADVLTSPPGETQKRDAIRVSLEHRTGECIAVFLPYRRGLLRRMTYGDLFASAADAVVFTEPVPEG